MNQNRIWGNIHWRANLQPPRQDPQQFANGFLDLSVQQAPTFDSDDQALWRTGLPRILNRIAIQEFFIFEQVIPNATILLQGVNKLHPKTYLRIDGVKHTCVTQILRQPETYQKLILQCADLFLFQELFLSGRFDEQLDRPPA